MTLVPVLRAEWLKIRTLRGVCFALVAVPVVTVAVTVLTQALDPGSSEPGDPLQSAFSAYVFGQLAAVTFGTVAVSAESSGGPFGIALAAVPRRGLLHTAKLLVVLVAGLLAGWTATLGAFLAGQALRADGMGLGDPGALRACFGGGVLLAAMTVLAAGLTLVLRSAVAVLSVLVPFLLFLPFVLGPGAGTVADWLPDRAGSQVLRSHAEGALGPWAGLGVCCLWALAAVVAGRVALARRDV